MVTKCNTHFSYMHAGYWYYVVQMDPQELRNTIIKYRDSSIHSSPEARAPLENAFRMGYSDYVHDAKFYRVCEATDVVFDTPSSWRPHSFVSACTSIASARCLLQRPPSIFANMVVELNVTGQVIYMVYDDGEAGERKKYEAEVIVCLEGVKRVHICS